MAHRESLLNTSDGVLRRRSSRKITHLVCGLLAGLTAEGELLIDFPDNPAGKPILARSLVPIGKTDEGREIALLFEQGDPLRPLAIGLLNTTTSAGTGATAEVDGEILTLSAERQIVLRCGEASITLTKAGKILIRGTYVLSRSTGVNMVKGATIHLN